MARWLLLCLVVCFSFGTLLGAPLQPDELSIQILPDRINKNILTCALCNTLITDLFQAFENGTSNEVIAQSIADRCESLVVLNAEVCGGFATLALPTIRYIYNSSQYILGNICGMLLQDQNCNFSDPDALEWSIRPSSIPKPPVIEQTPPPQGSPTLKVLHLADVHWDPEYLEGSLANCFKDGYSLCCRASSGNVTDPSDAAGYWGDYRTCDMPWRTIENAVAHMAQVHSDAAYIIWTGDLVPHDMWDTSKEENIMINDRLLNLMKQYFPNTPLYATLGNHEGSPANVFAPPEITDPEFSTSWLYNEADIQWAKWLPASTSSTIRYGGYYTALVRPGLRIVSMNMNYCYTFNYWTFYNSQDPASSLIWLNQILEAAEQAGEKVHILSHIPPGNSDCWSIFSREFEKIINRFELTVAAQFYGHTHKEEFKVFYDTVNITRPINVAFVGGSLTTYTDMNPGYRVYTIDGPRIGSSYAVLDHSTWIFNLTAANIQGPGRNPVWFEFYQAKNEYGLADLSPKSMDNFFQRMLTDDALFLRYYKNYYKGSDDKVAEGCNARCRQNLLCFTVTTNIADQSRCNQIRRLINERIETTDF